MTEPSNSTVSAQIGFGPRIRKSPYFDATMRAGASGWSVYNHVYMPLWYDSPEADYQRLLKYACLWDVACQRQVQISGPDAGRFVQHLTPRNLASCQVGQCKYVLMTDEAGGIVNDPVLLKLADDRYWLSLADSDALLWVKGVALGLSMDVEVNEPDVAPLQLQGPRSRDILFALLGGDLPMLRYFRFFETELDGIPMLISRTGWSGEYGFEIYLRDSSRGDDLWGRIMAAGEPFGIGPGGPSTIRRIEAGLLSYGADITLEVNPYEAGLGRLVDLDMESDFVGKAALTRIHQVGVSRRLAGFEIGGEPLAAPNQQPWPVSDGGEAIGRVTSCVFSPSLNRNIGLGFVPVAGSENGAKVKVSDPSGARPATVKDLPFVAHRANLNPNL